ncbi:MAG: VCBS repeat-containing protein [Planctomycetes bacterium]|nr:VCBS repeat-containing protein [Planctomycetota bacterium]
MTCGQSPSREILEVDGGGVALFDYDNDGDFDLFITNIFDDGFHNVLLRNDTAYGGKLAFTEVSESLGVRDTGWAWGTTFFDADHDGLLDLAATNGWFSDPWRDDPSKFFWNLGGDPVEMLDVSDEVGFNDTFSAAR